MNGQSWRSLNKQLQSVQEKLGQLSFSDYYFIHHNILKDKMSENRKDLFQLGTHGLLLIEEKKCMAP